MYVHILPCSQRLILLFFSILKDVPNIPAESYGPRQRDSVRLSVFPNLNYAGLYKAALSMIDLVPTVQIGQLGKSKARLLFLARLEQHPRVMFQIYLCGLLAC